MVTAPPEVPLEDGVHQAGRRHVNAWGYSESRSHLTPREEQILQFVAHGWSAKEIARHIAIAPRTVERHIENARLKIGARNTPHMIACAFSTGALDPGAFSPEAVGELFGVEFGDNFPTPARVARVESNCVGIAFGEKVDVADALETIAPAEERQARRLHFAVEINGFAVTKRRRKACQLLEISQGGARIRTDATLLLTERIKLEVTGLGTITGTVRWLRDGDVGITFSGPLPYRELEAWIHTRARIAKPAPIIDRKWRKQPGDCRLEPLTQDC